MNEFTQPKKAGESQVVLTTVTLKSTAEKISQSVSVV